MILDSRVVRIQYALSLYCFGLFLVFLFFLVVYLFIIVCVIISSCFPGRFACNTKHMPAHTSSCHTAQDFGSTRVVLVQCSRYPNHRRRRAGYNDDSGFHGHDGLKNLMDLHGLEHKRVEGWHHDDHGEGGRFDFTFVNIPSEQRPALVALWFHYVPELCAGNYAFVMPAPVVPDFQWCVAVSGLRSYKISSYELM